MNPVYTTRPQQQLYRRPHLPFWRRRSSPSFDSKCWRQFESLVRFELKPKKERKRKKKKVDRRLSSVAVVAVTLCSAGPSHPNPPHPPLRRRPFSYPSFAGALVHAQFSRWPTVRLCVQRLSSLRQHPISLSLFLLSLHKHQTLHTAQVHLWFRWQSTLSQSIISGAEVKNPRVSLCFFHFLWSIHIVRYTPVLCTVWRKRVSFSTHGNDLFFLSSCWSIHNEQETISETNRVATWSS